MSGSARERYTHDTKAMVAHLAGAGFKVSARTLREYAQRDHDPCPSFKGLGKTSPRYFNPADVESWIRRNGHDGRSGRPAGGGIGGATPPKPGATMGMQAKLAQANLELRIQNARAAKRRNDIADGLVHSVEECQERSLAKIHAVRDAMRAWPSRISAGLPEPHRTLVFQRVEDEIARTLARFAGDDASDAEAAA